MAENRKHKRSCSEFSEFNSPSIEPSDSEQHNEGILGSWGTGEARTNQRAPEEEIGRYISSSGRPVVFPPDVELRRWYTTSSVLVETGFAQSQLCFGVSFPHRCLSVHPSRCS